MAHLNQTRNVNEPWVVDHMTNHARKEVEFFARVPDFTLRLYAYSFDMSILDGRYLIEMVPTQVQMIALAEYLWRPNYYISLTLMQAIQTIQYLEATRG